MGISTKQIGDGKLPNKYWVSIAEDYYYESEPGVMDWASDHGVVKSPKGATIKVFDSYQAAKRFVDEELSVGEEYDGIVVNTITIEDRLSGEVFWRGKEFSPRRGHVWESEREDLGFTQQKEAELRADRVSKRKPRARKSTPGASVRGIRG